MRSTRARWSLILSLALATSCGATAGAPGESIVGLASPSPTTSGSSNRQRAEVVRVTDGDTIRVRIDGQEFAVRYIGIDTPETVDPRTSPQCLGAEAAAANRRLVEGKTVELEKDVSETDRFDRLLRYVYVDGNLINEQLVRDGYARSSTYPPDVKHQIRFVAAEQQARAAERGLWASGACASSPTSAASPTATTSPRATQLATAVPRTATPATSNPRANCDSSYPTICLPPPPPDLDCGEIPYRRFTVLPPDRHRLDADGDGIGCES